MFQKVSVKYIKYFLVLAVEEEVESEISKPIFPFQRDLISERMLAALHRGASLQCSFVRAILGHSRKIFEMLR